VSAGPPTLDSVRAGGKAALAAALARLERAPDDPATIALLDAAYGEARAHVVGITGPPGVGKSTLIGTLIGEWRSAGRSVGVIAVDPSSRASGGALLGDRTRLRTDPADAGVFVRSQAARDRLGGLAALTVSSMVLMRALFDIVLIETVGVGQSETDVVGAADTVVLCVQPGSGDTLQFMKAGIVEIPHIVVVTKADMGDLAERTRRDVRAALRLGDEGREAELIAVSAQNRNGVPALAGRIDGHFATLRATGRLAAARREQAARWIEEAIRERFGREGLRKSRGAVPGGDSPFAAIAAAARILGDSPAGG
jgi:LAO/AO transport system kinase